MYIYIYIIPVFLSFPITINILLPRMSFFPQNFIDIRLFHVSHHSTHGLPCISSIFNLFCDLSFSFLLAQLLVINP